MKENTSNIQNLQQERLTEIGEELRTARLARNWTLHFAGRQTKIRATLLKHIEKAELRSLPEPIYIKSLILRYANFLGLEGEAIAERFPIGEKPHGWQLPFWQRLSLQFHLRPVHLYTVYLLVIVTTVQSLSGSLRPRTQLSLDPQLQGATEVSRARIPDQSLPNPQTSVAPVATLVSSLPERSTASDSLVIDIEAQGESWVEVEVDGQPAFKGLLQKGVQKKWVADESLTIRSGNAGAVIIQIDNEQPQPLGEPGEVDEFTFQASASNSDEPQRSIS